MTAKCPCCGHDVAPGAVAVDLGSNTLAVGWSALRVKLTPKEAEILQALVEADRRGATHDYIVQRVWGIAEPNDPDSVVKAWMCTIRKKIAAVGLRLTNNRKGTYRLETPDLGRSLAGARKVAA